MNTRALLSSLAVLLLCHAGVAAAQSRESRFEIGGQATMLRLSDFDTTSAGVGGRFTFNLARWAAVEAEADYIPSDDVEIASTTFTHNLLVIYRRNRADAFFGVKLGVRRDRFGVFAKVRPGVTRLSGGGPECVGEVCALVLLAVPTYRTEFALDLGSVLELYPTARTVARFDLGDTMIRHRSAAPPCYLPGCTSHNLSSRVGIGLRF